MYDHRLDEPVQVEINGEIQSGRWAGIEGRRPCIRTSAGQLVALPVGTSVYPVRRRTPRRGPIY